MAQSDFSFRPHKPSAGEDKTHGLMDVYDRATGEHLGMLNPHSDGGYILRNTDGVRLSVEHPEFDDLTYVSRETSASILRQRVRQFAELAAKRVDSVSEGCPNTWHNTSGYRAVTACPECPSQPGLKLALARIESLIRVREDGGDDAGALEDARDELADLIYKAES